jgi:hypothetical protein
MQRGAGLGTHKQRTPPQSAWVAWDGHPPTHRSTPAESPRHHPLHPGPPLSSQPHPQDKALPPACSSPHPPSSAPMSMRACCQKPPPACASTSTWYAEGWPLRRRKRRPAVSGGWPLRMRRRRQQPGGGSSSTLDYDGVSRAQPSPADCQAFPPACPLPHPRTCR